VSQPVTEQGRSGETGDQRVDRVLTSLEGLDGVPVSEHVGVFDRAHEALREALADASAQEGGTHDGIRPPGTPGSGSSD
jgi:hypothetical protein